MSYKSDKTPGGFQPSRACRYSSGRIKNKKVLCCTLIEGKWVTYVKQRLKVKALQYPVCVLTAKPQECTMTREMGKREGILVGISSGTALSVAIKEAKKEDNKGKTIVVLLPDTGDRYFSTPLFKEE